MPEEELEGVEAPEENWTRYPNVILDNLADYTGNELKVLSLMIRKNHGWTKRRANKRFSLTYIQTKTGIKSKATANNAVQSLLKRKAIKRISVGRDGARYEVNWSGGSKIKPARRSKNRTASGSKNKPPAVQKLNPLKETSEKKPSKERQEAEAQLRCFLEHWQSLTSQEVKQSKRFEGYFFGAVKREGFQRLMNAAEGYAKSDWHAERKAWNLQRFLVEPSLVARFAPEESKLAAAGLLELPVGRLEELDFLSVKDEMKKLLTEEEFEEWRSTGFFQRKAVEIIIRKRTA